MKDEVDLSVPEVILPLHKISLPFTQSLKGMRSPQTLAKRTQENIFELLTLIASTNRSA